MRVNATDTRTSHVFLALEAGKRVEMTSYLPEPGGQVTLRQREIQQIVLDFPANSPDCEIRSTCVSEGHCVCCSIVGGPLVSATREKRIVTPL